MRSTRPTSPSPTRSSDDAVRTTPGAGTGADCAHCKDAAFCQWERSGGETEGMFRADLANVFERDDGRVVGLHHNDGRRNGELLDTDCCIVFEVEDFRITSGPEHFLDLHDWDQFWPWVSGWRDAARSTSIVRRRRVRRVSAGAR